MACSRIKFKDGSSAIVCGPAARVPKCHFCNLRPATQLCDFVIVWTLGGAPITCDEKICEACGRQETTNPDADDLDICPRHRGKISPKAPPPAAA